MPAVRVNALTNPALKVNSTGWTFNLGARSTTLTGMARTTGVSLLASDYVVAPETSGVVAGQTWTASCEVKPASTGAVEFNLEWRSGPGSFLSKVTITPTLTGGAATRVSITAVAPATAVILTAVPSTVPSGVAADVTAFLLEQVDYPGGYFDGDTVGAVWTGTAGNSTSQMVVPDPAARGFSRPRASLF